MNDTYVSLHNHTFYSTLDGLNKPIELAQTAKEMGSPAIAITDHGTLAGIPEFFEACRKTGVKPILGNEMYSVPDITIREILITPTKKQSRSGYHLTLLAKNATGFKNLVALNNIAFMRGFYYYPKIDWKALLEHKEGLIVLSACASSELSQYSIMDRAHNVAPKFKEAFGDDYYMELMDNYMVKELQRGLNEKFLEAAKKFNIKCVATNDAHYLKQDMYDIHDVATCIQQKKTISTPGRLKYDGFYHLKSMTEMIKVFPREAINNTLEVAEKIEAFDIYDKTMRLPLMMGEDPDVLLRMLATDGLKKRNLTGAVYIDRLNRELEVIAKLGLSAYFLVTKDIIDSSIRSIGCTMAWGRGSSASSLVCYALRITDVDPIKSGLLFERFVNPHRPDWPDIDIDVPQQHRQEVIAKIFEKYGIDKVAHISTMHNLRPKMLVKDLCKTLELDAVDAAKLAGAVPFEATGWDDLKDNKKFTDIVDTMPDSNKLMGYLQYLLGLPKHLGTHASGIIISSDPITDRLPIRMDDTKMVSQYTMHHVHKFGFMKFDILGLKTLDIIFAAAKDAGIDLKNIPMEDKKTFDLIGEGRVIGVFQLDGSHSYIKLCRDMKPIKFDEICHIVALHRPGIMDSGQLTVYLDRRAGRIPVKYIHPDLEPILKENYGICIFQEDMMKMAQVFANFSLAEAEDLRKAIAKKDPELMKLQSAKFTERATALGRDKDSIASALSMLEASARYSWNKAHGYGYGHITYACAYLSANYPLQFFTHLINMASEEDKSTYLTEAMARGLKILPPDVNRSNKNATIDGDAIRLGLTSIKGIGDAIADKIIKNRPYDKIDKLKATVNKTAITLLYSVKAVSTVGDAETWDPGLKADESTLLGISLSNNQADYDKLIKVAGADPVHTIAGIGTAIVKILTVKEVTDKLKRKMAFLTGVDVHGPKHDMVMFATEYQEMKPKPGETYIMTLRKTPIGSMQIRGLISTKEYIERYNKNPANAEKIT